MTTLAVADIAHLPLADNSVDMIFTDPPYLRQYLPCYGHLAREAMRVLKPGGFVLAECGGAYLNQVLRHFDDAGLTFWWLYQLEMTGAKTGVVWPYGNQSVHISTRVKHFAAYSKGRSMARTCTTGKFTSDGGDKRYHIWGQDVVSARYYIDCFSAPGDTVLDPFIGGGTTAVACELIGRNCIGFDIDPAAIEITRNRLAGTAFPVDLPLLRLLEDA